MANPYSKQLLTTIKNNINVSLLRFFERKGTVYHFPVEKMEEMITSLLDENVKGIIYKEEISIETRKLYKRRDMRRARWTKSYLEMLDSNDYDNVKHPLHSQYELFKQYDETQFYDLTKAHTMEQLADIAKVKCKDWKGNPRGYSIDFPGLSLQSDKLVYNAFRDDVMVDIWRYIEEKLDGNINMFMSPYPEMLLDQPIFSPISFRLDLAKSGNTLQESIRDVDNNEIVVLSVNEKPEKTGLSTRSEMSTALRTMDETDAKILSVVLANATDVVLDGKNEIVMWLDDLYEKVSTEKRPSEYGRERIKSRLDKMVDYSYKITSENKKLNFNFFDHIAQEETKNGTKLTFSFGDMLYESIIQNKLINITRETLTKLEDPLAKILVYFLQKNRVFTLKSGKTETDITYAQIFRASRFPTANKKKNLDMICHALQNMIDNHSLVEKFTQNGDTFQVTFVPLSDEEKEDLERNDNGILIQGKF